MSAGAPATSPDSDHGSGTINYSLPVAPESPSGDGLAQGSPTQFDALTAPPSQDASFGHRHLRPQLPTGQGQGEAANGDANNDRTRQLELEIDPNTQVVLTRDFILKKQSMTAGIGQRCGTG